MMHGMEETAVEMGDVIKEMGEHMPEGFLWHHVFLPANMAILPLHDRAAIQAVFFLALGDMRHVLYFGRPPFCEGSIY